MSLESILEEVRKNEGCDLVEVTGGEPLMQEQTPELIDLLIQNGYTVLLETAGSIDISSLNRETIRVVDMKCPGSGMVEKNLYSNLDLMTEKDELKFVVRDKADFDWSVDLIHKHSLENKTQIIFSPVFGELEREKLAEWLMESGLKARMQLQLHKLIWGPDKKGV